MAVHQTREAHATENSTSPPSTIQVNHQQGHDTQGTTVTHASAPTTPEPGTVLRHMLSNNRARTSDASAMTANHTDTDDTIVINGCTYRASVTYCVHSDGNNRHATGSLMDGGSNGGLAGSDVLILETSLDEQVDVTRVTSGTLKQLPIVQAAGIVDTHDEGPIICIKSQYAQCPTGKSIHSKGQFEHFGCIVHDTPISKSGYQCVVTPEGFVIPLHVRDGLHYMDMRPPTPHELETLPHVFLTDDSQWNPSILDDEFHDTNDLPTDPAILSRRDSRDPCINDTGSINHIRQIDALHFFDSFDHLPPELTFLERTANALLAFPQRLHLHFCDLDILKPHFGWVSADRIQRTLEHTTQFYRTANHFPLRCHFKSRVPAANVRRLPEWYSTDTIFSDVPAADDGIPGHGGCTMAQLYGGIDSHFLKLITMSSEKDLPFTLEEFIRDHGAMQGLKSDNAKSETSHAMHDILQLYCIKDKQSEPHYENQNPIERCIQDIKRMTNNIMDRVACPAKYWLLTMLFVVGLLNVLVNTNGAIPEQLVTGEIVDVSPYLEYHFWE